MMLTIGLGIFIGLVMGLTGAGGGIIAVPMLVFFLNLAIVDATPIALIGVLCAASIGTVIGLYQHLVRYRAAIVMAVAGASLSPLGILFALQLNHRLLLVMLSVMLFFVAYHTMQSQHTEIKMLRERPTVCSRHPQSGKFQWTSRCTLFIALSGALAGFLSGLLGIGGGFVIVPALQRMNKLPVREVIGTSLAVIAFISLSVIATKCYQGAINWPVAVPFAIGSVIGILVGRRLLSVVDERKLKYGFIVLTACVAVITLLKALIN